MIRFINDPNNDSQILVVGVGGGAKGTIDSVAGLKLRGIETAFIDTKIIKELDQFVNSLPKAQVTFTVTGLGGSTGTVITPYLIDLMKKKSFWIWSLLTLPFFFEGKQKIINSLKGLKSIQKLVNALLVIPHDKVFKMVDKNVEMYKAFLSANEVCVKLISSMYRLTMSSNRIKIDISDIKKRLADRKSTAFGTGIASGNNRVPKAMEDAVRDSLLGNEVLSKTRNLVVSITGGEDLKLKEIETGVEFLKTLVPQEMNVNFGVAIEKSWKEKVEINIIALGLDDAVHDISNGLGITLVNRDDVQGKEKINRQITSRITRTTKLVSKPKQTIIDFKPSFKGRFDKSQPTLHHGEDLDVPTFLRRKKVPC